MATQTPSQSGAGSESTGNPTPQQVVEGYFSETIAADADLAYAFRDITADLVTLGEQSTDDKEIRDRILFNGLIDYGKKWVREADGVDAEEVRDTIVRHLDNEFWTDRELARHFKKEGITDPTDEAVEEKAATLNQNILDQITARSPVERLLAWPKKALEAKKLYSEKAAAQRKVYEFNPASPFYSKDDHKSAEEYLADREIAYKQARISLIGVSAVSGAFLGTIGGEILTSLDHTRSAVAGVVGASIGFAVSEAKLRFNKWRVSEDQRKEMLFSAQNNLDTYVEHRPIGWDFENDKAYKELVAERNLFKKNNLRDHITARWAEWDVGSTKARVNAALTVGAIETAGFVKKTISKVQGDGLWERKYIVDDWDNVRDQFTTLEKSDVNRLNQDLDHLKAGDEADWDREAIAAKQAELIALSNELKRKYGEEVLGNRPTRRGLVVFGIGIATVASVVAATWLIKDGNWHGVAEHLPGGKGKGKASGSTTTTTTAPSGSTSSQVTTTTAPPTTPSTEAASSTTVVPPTSAPAPRTETPQQWFNSLPPAQKGETSRFLTGMEAVQSHTGAQGEELNNATAKVVRLINMKNSYVNGGSTPQERMQRAQEWEANLRRLQELSDQAA